MKISFNKAMAFIIIAAIIICLFIVTIFMVNGNKNKETNSTNQPLTNLNNLAYDGTTELGTPVKFTINEITPPEAVSEYETSFKINGNSWYYDLDAEGNAINIYAFGNFSGDVIIPDTLDGHKVISIGKNNSSLDNSLFYTSIGGEDYWDNITSITVPEGVKYINDDAFSGYKKLERVILPDSIVYIGDDAFRSSSNLAYINSDVEGKVVMPKNLQYYGESIFAYDDKINAFEFPQQINYIQDWTFYATEGFSNLTIPGQFEYIGEGAFADSEIENLTIEDGVKIIKDDAFEMNESLKKVNLADSVISIGKNAFYLCKSLSEFNYNGKLSYIGKEVFDYTKVKDVLKSNQLP